MIVGMLVEEVPLSAEKSRTEVAVAVEAEGNVVFDLVEGSSFAGSR